MKKEKKKNCLWSKCLNRDGKDDGKTHMGAVFNFEQRWTHDGGLFYYFI